MNLGKSSLPPIRLWPWLSILLLAVFAGAGFNSLIRDAATFDETAHLPAGFTYLDRGDFRLNPEHPPLSKIWAALPLWLGHLADPDYRSPFWLGTARSETQPSRTKASQWLFGFEFLNGRLGDVTRKDPSRLLVPARSAMLLLGVALAVIVYCWSRELWGREGALLSLFLACLSPTLLAHARLVTTDLPAALAFSIVLWTFWRLCRQPGWLRASVLALCMAAALLVKFSALLLPPTLLLLGLLWICWPGLARGERMRRLRWLAAAALVVLVVAYAGLWAGYGFRFDAAEAGYDLDWEVVGLKEGPAADLVHGALRARVLPEGYLYGVAYFLGGAERRVAFLNGEQSLIGWWYYFPQAFLMKSSPALLAFLCWVGFASTRAGRWRSFDGWYLLLPVVVYMGVSVLSNLNIGHRHLVPIYPLLFVLCGTLPKLSRGRRHGIALAAVLVFLYAASFVVATPRYLSYFNLLAGGADGGWRYLLDSNIDWGQDLARLERWMKRNQVDEIDLVYFGTADPLAYEIPHRKILIVQDFHPDQPTVQPEPGRLVAVSVNLLQGLYFDQDQAFAGALQRRRLVTHAQIDQWLDLRNRLSKEGQRHPDFATWAVQEGIVDEQQRRSIEDQLLTGWFRRLREEHEPLAKAGDSIFIYRTPGP